MNPVRHRLPDVRSVWQWFPIVLLSTWTLLTPASAFGQEFIDQALPYFPEDTGRIEYFSPETWRKVPEYSSLRDRFLGPHLKVLAQSFSQLGVREEHIDEMVIGWLRLHNGYMALGGLARGRFDSEKVAARADEGHIPPIMVGDWRAYCVGEEMSCLAVLDESHAAFGPADFLGALGEAREGRVPNILSHPIFMNLFGEIRTQPPLWGIAVGEAVPDWFGVWLAGPSGATFDWRPLLESAQALTFRVDAPEKVELHMSLDFSAPEAADRLRQTLETLRQLQQLVWQNQSPGRANPLDGLKMTRAGSRVSLDLSAERNQLREGNPFSAAN
jgi:hypothetical protein